ncbi:methionine biosynthesis protein MetW [Bartonella sp. DGB2]|uniref:methionine biosynthesis protein MetW n=1 Tax=Bartonella sp. DGB2 TaxID=3388426 RepID=UPI0039901B8E
MTMSTAAINSARVDFQLISRFVAPKSRVLDVGCGDGALLMLLQKERNVDGRGVEISQKGVDQCLKKGLAVIQGDADRDLIYYPDQGFDYVILSQTLQATRNPKQVLDHLLRIGTRAIISIPNFGYWRVRASLMFGGRMPMTKELPYHWYDTPNIHFCTIKDFIHLVGVAGAHIEKAVALQRNGQALSWNLPYWAWNLFGQQAVFVLRRS